MILEIPRKTCSENAFGHSADFTRKVPTRIFYLQPQMHWRWNLATPLDALWKHVSGSQRDPSNFHFTSSKRRKKSFKRTLLCHSALQQRCKIRNPYRSEWLTSMTKQWKFASKIMQIDPINEFETTTIPMARAWSLHETPDPQYQLRPVHTEKRLTMPRWTAHTFFKP